MSKIDSPSSNNSITSSETSETQSVEENIPTNANETRNAGQQSSNIAIERTPKKPKRMKDPNNDKDEKRPPWRAVSLSTLPKPDKNALLKAKLLDASRRLRAGKSSIATQTDIVPTKLMKEVNLGTQVDLILHREVGMMTDGSYMKRKEGSDEFVLTYAVSTLTDEIKYNNVATQTLLPHTQLPEDNFMKAYYECDLSDLNSKQFTEVQRKLLQQICKIKNKTKTIQSNNYSTENSSNDTRDIQSVVGDATAHSLLNTSTLNAWHFELDEIGGDVRQFQPYTITANRPWQSFAPLSLNGLYSEGMSNHRLDWNILLLAIDELVCESNYLVDIIEDLTKAQIKTVDTPKFEYKPQKMPSEYWIPIIEEQERELETIINQFKEATES